MTNASRKLSAPLTVSMPFHAKILLCRAKDYNHDCGASPHFSPSFCCGGGSGHVYGVALPWAPRHTVKYACGALRRAPCIHARLHRLATKHGEKCGLVILKRYTNSPDNS